MVNDTPSSAGLEVALIAESHVGELDPADERRADAGFGAAFLGRLVDQLATMA